MLTWTATAIRIAEMEGLDLSRDLCPQLSDAEYVRRRQVWNAIIFMSGQVKSKTPMLSLTGCRWLAVVTGRTPHISPYTTRDPFIQVW